MPEPFPKRVKGNINHENYMPEERPKCKAKGYDFPTQVSLHAPRPQAAEVTNNKLYSKLPHSPYRDLLPTLETAPTSHKQHHLSTRRRGLRCVNWVMREPNTGATVDTGEL